MKNYWLAPRCIDVPLARNREVLVDALALQLSERKGMMELRPLRKVV